MKQLTINKNERLTVEKHVITGTYPVHWHKFFEIEIITSGSGRQTVNDNDYDISEKHVLLIAPTDFHCVKTDGKVEIINISFDSNMISEKNLTTIVSQRMQKDYVLSDDEYKNMISAASLLKHEYETDGDCKKQLLEYILSCILRKTDIDNAPDSNVEICKGIKKAIIFMELNFKENITMDMAAKKAGYSPTYFSEIFKKTTGESYIKTLTRLRLNHAKTLLKNDYSVKDACFLSGFNSLSNFYVSFKTNFGISPSDYSKRAARENK